MDPSFTRVESGQRASVKFSIMYDPKWGEISKHTLRKAGSQTMTKVYTIRADEVVFDRVRVEDSGTYTINCGNEAGEASAQFALDVTPPKGNYLC